jgi:lysophospholipase L1-like esterase
VTNFGVSRTTLLKAGDYPYWTTDKFTQSHDLSPNIVVIMLGTNDSKPHNWRHQADFVSNYEELIDSYANLATAPRIFLNLPPPAGTNGFNISGTVIEAEILPLIEQAAVAKPVTVVDVFGAWGGHDFDHSFFGSPEDQVHPNAAGAQLIADTVYAVLMASAVNPGGASSGTGGAPSDQGAQVPDFDFGVVGSGSCAFSLFPNASTSRALIAGLAMFGALLLIRRST